MSTAFTIISLVGAITWYGGSAFEGRPLSCGGTYSAQEPWIAIDPFLRHQGWECGQRVELTFSGGEVMVARVLDTGYLTSHYVEDFGPQYPIIADVGAPYWPLEGVMSDVGVIINLDLMQKEGAVLLP